MTKEVRAGIRVTDSFIAVAFFVIGLPQTHSEQPAKIEGVGVFRPSGNFVKERGAYIVSLKTGITWIELRNSR